MRIAYRIFILIAVFIAVSLLMAQLGRTGWAENIRIDSAKYRADHPPPTSNPRPPLRPGPSYAQPFEKVGLIMGIPGGLTLGVLAVSRRRRKKQESMD